MLIACTDRVEDALAYFLKSEELMGPSPLQFSVTNRSLIGQAR